MDVLTAALQGSKYYFSACFAKKLLFPFEELVELFGAVKALNLEQP